ncbi:MAG: S1 RNA-binding domain-containing protein [Chloroflexota bacterium]
MTGKSNDNVPSMDDLQPKTRLEGKVKEVGLHGAVVDVGLPYEGLLHISQLTPDGEVDAVTEAVEVGDEVTVWVTELHPEERRVSLTMVEPPDVTWDEVREGKLHTGRVTRIEQYGAFVDVGAERPGLLHVREMSSGYVDHPSELVSVGDEIEVRILRVDRRRQRIDLTRQGLEEEAVQEPEPEEAAEEAEESAQTAMELAMERARADREQGAGEAQRSKKRRREDPEREEILQRTLEQHSGEEQ